MLSARQKPRRRKEDATVTDPIAIFAWGDAHGAEASAPLLLAGRLQAHFAGSDNIVVNTYRQLGPQVVDDLAGNSFAIFLDANTAPDAPPVDRSRVRPAPNDTLGTHECTPAELLALGAALGLRLPESWQIAIRAPALDGSSDRRPDTASFVTRAERVVLRMIDRRLRSELVPTRT
jgi:Ni,Fe-hydrogenase maturation factor